MASREGEEVVVVTGAETEMSATATRLTVTKAETVGEFRRDFHNLKTITLNPNRPPKSAFFKRKRLYN